MSHINSLGASIFSDMAIAMPTADPAFNTLDTAAEFEALFSTEIETKGGTRAANTFVRVKNVREFPAIGNPPNIVNVPTYGQKSSQQVQGQSDAPSLEITVNYIPADWATGTLLGDAVGNSKLYVFRFALLNTEPTGVGATKFASSVAGLGTVENSVWYWIGKIEALLVNPQLTDATTATVTFSIQSKNFGAYSL